MGNSCGPILRNYDFPKGSFARCTKNVCKIQCNNDRIPFPKVIKCFPKKKQWVPKPFSKIRCVDKDTLKAEARPPLVGFFENGFSDSKNTMTKCGDMKDKDISLAEGVGFKCHDHGCTYACAN